MNSIYRHHSPPSFGFDRNIPPVVEVVSRVARRLWPIKTARNLASRTRKTHRAAEDWIATRTGMSADALADLLRSDAGRDVLEAIMGDAPPSWWPEFQTLLKLDGLERRQEEVRRELEAFKNGLL